MVETYLSVFTLPGENGPSLKRGGKKGGEAEVRRLRLKERKGKKKERKEWKEKWILRAPFESGGERRRAVESGNEGRRCGRASEKLKYLKRK